MKVPFFGTCVDCGREPSINLLLLMGRMVGFKRSGEYWLCECCENRLHLKRMLANSSVPKERYSLGGTTNEPETTAVRLVRQDARQANV